MKIWGAVNRKIKTLGLGFGLFNGSLDAWGVVVLPVYLTKFARLPGVCGRCDNGGIHLSGADRYILFKIRINLLWERRKLGACGFLLIPVSLIFPLATSLLHF